MEYVELLTILLGITLVSKIVASYTKTVDILWYIILGLIGTQYIFHIDPLQLENSATIGVICIMFYAGWHQNLITFLEDVWKNKWIALTAAIGPFIGGLIAFALLNFSWNEAIVAGFIFTSTAVPYTTAVLRNLKLEETPAAKAILSSAMTDNFITIFLSVGILPTFALLSVGNEIGGISDLSGIIQAASSQIGLVAGSFVIFGLLGLVVLPDKGMKMEKGIPHALQRDGIRSRIAYFVYRLRQGPGLRTLGERFFGVNIGIPLTLFLVFGLSILAHHMGLHPAIGAYLTGLILHPSMFRGGDVQVFDPHFSLSINHTNLSTFFYFLQEWLGPIFFIYLGSQLIADFSRIGEVVLFAVIGALFVGFFQFITAYGAGRVTSGLSKHDSLLLGFGMLPYDVLAFVVLGIATSAGLIQTESFFVIVIIVTILVINIMTIISLRWYKPRYLRAVAQADEDEEMNDSIPS